MTQSNNSTFDASSPSLSNIWSLRIPFCFVRAVLFLLHLTFTVCLLALLGSIQFGLMFSVYLSLNDLYDRLYRSLSLSLCLFGIFEGSLGFQFILIMKIRKILIFVLFLRVV